MRDDISSTKQKTLDTVYAKILLELDRSNTPNPGEIFVCGLSIPDTAVSFLQMNFPGAHCTYLTDIPLLDTSLVENYSPEDVVSFAVPVGLATGNMLKKSQAYSHTDFLPGHLKKEQNSVRIAWHGYGVIACIFQSSLFYTY